jgi:hypothetical protein
MNQASEKPVAESYPTFWTSAPQVPSAPVQESASAFVCRVDTQSDEVRKSSPEPDQGSE